MAKKRVIHPLTADHLNILNKVIEACNETQEYCQMCTDCDLDVEPEKRKNEEQRKIAEKIKRRFFPEAR